MAYASVAQADADPLTGQPAHTNLTSISALSPTIPRLPLAPFTLNFDDLSGDVAMDEPSANAANRDSKVSKILSSMTGSTNSYDLVEDDDYEELDVTGSRRTNQMASPISQDTASPTEPDLPVRTASVSRQLPLKHPRPDLQSLQGAYVKNVERLEESAERLSMTSSLGELRQNAMQQTFRERTASGSSKDTRGARLHKVSTTSLSNSIVDVNAAARSGGFSPAGYVGSPVGSVQSSRNVQTAMSSRQAQRASKLNPLTSDSPSNSWSGEASVNTNINAPSRAQEAASSNSHASGLSQERPNSAGSGDTYQQARTLFTDFDGVHYNATRASRRISLSRPPRARDSRAFKEPQPGEEMIFYPAPVPVMLNLPVRLSRMNWSEREKKRLQALSEMPDDMRKSAPWLANEEVAASPVRQSQAKLPPQLRASAFFDHRGTEMNVQLKDGSAVATLDSILDAAAHAPVSAFTDHPIAGHLGKEVYGPSPSRKSMQAQKRKPKRKSSLNNLLKSGDSQSNLGVDSTDHKRTRSSDAIEEEHEEGSADVDEHGSASASDDEEGAEGEEQSGSEEESEDDTRYPGFSKAPTTLLAELQMRKAQQKQRNRTAADAFPNGMHSTLLELDTVTQLQQKARKQKHITLAWEDHEEADRENFDDDDVPLGVLYPEQDRKETANVNRPLGLMEKREMEENEPLSLRRARLRGEPLIPPSISKSPSHMDEAPRIEESTLEENAEETLGQRLKRLRELKENGSTSDFAREVNSELGLHVPEPEPSKTKTPDPEETLGQRRRRLKEEAAINGSNTLQPTLTKTGSMADLLQRNPVQYVHPGEGKTAATAMQTYQQQLQRDPAFLAQQQAAAMMSRGFGGQSVAGMGMQSPYMNHPYGQQNASYFGSNIQIPTTNYGMPMTMMNGMNQQALPYGMPGYGHPANALDMGPPLNAKQRATIDQWRQGIA